MRVLLSQCRGWRGQWGPSMLSQEQVEIQVLSHCEKNKVLRFGSDLPSGPGCAASWLFTLPMALVLLGLHI